MQGFPSPSYLQQTMQRNQTIPNTQGGHRPAKSTVSLSLGIYIVPIITLRSGHREASRLEVALEELDLLLLVVVGKSGRSGAESSALASSSAVNATSNGCGNRGGRGALLMLA